MKRKILFTIKELRSLESKIIKNLELVNAEKNEMEMNIFNHLMSFKHALAGIECDIDDFKARKKDE